MIDSIHPFVHVQSKICFNRHLKSNRVQVGRCLSTTSQEYRRNKTHPVFYDKRINKQFDKLYIFKDTKKGNTLDLLKTPEMRKRTLIVWYLW